MTSQQSTHSSCLDDLKVIHPELFLNETKLRLGSKIAEGTFAQVFHGTYSAVTGDVNVAVKQLKTNVIAVAGPELYREVKSMLRVASHPNVAKIIGVLVGDSDSSRYGFCLILEFAHYGTLFDVLKAQNCNGSPITLPQKLQILLDICDGVKALHSQKVVHADLKSCNVLLFDAGDGSIIAKLADFGMSIAVSSSASIQSMSGGGGMGTLNWLAPEVGEEPNTKPHHTRDIWAVGMLIYEILTDKMPYFGMNTFQVTNYLLVKRVLPNMDIIPDTMPTELKDLMVTCCNFQVAKRPDIDTVLVELAKISQKVRSAALATVGPTPPRSTKNFDELRMLLLAIKEDTHRLKDIEQDTAVIRSAVETQTRELRQVLTTVLSLSNEELYFPRMFMILPMKQAGSSGKLDLGGGSSSWFDKFDVFNHFIILFICERTFKTIPYGNQPGLPFSILKDKYGNVVVSMSDFFKKFGPALQLAAMAVSTALTITSGLRLGDIVPSSLLEDAANGFDSAQSIMATYCSQVETLASSCGEWNDLRRVGTSSDHMSFIENNSRQLEPIGRKAYYHFYDFLSKHCDYNKQKLLENASIVPAEDGSAMHWVKHETSDEPSNNLLPPPPPFADYNHDSSGGSTMGSGVREAAEAAVSYASVLAPTDEVLWSGSVEKGSYSFSSRVKHLELFSDRICFFNPDQKTRATSSLEVNSNSIVTSDNNGNLVLKGGRKKGNYMSSDAGEVTFKVLEASERSRFKDCILNVIERHQVKLKEPIALSWISKLQSLLDGKKATSVSDLENKLREVFTNFQNEETFHSYSEVEMKLKQVIEQVKQKINALKHERETFERDLIDAGLSLLSSNRDKESIDKISQWLAQINSVNPPLHHEVVNNVKNAQQRIKLVSGVCDKFRLAIQKHRAGFDKNALTTTIVSEKTFTNGLNLKFENENVLYNLLTEANDLVEQDRQKLKQFEQSMIDRGFKLLSMNRDGTIATEISQYLKEANNAIPPFRHELVDELKKTEQRIQKVHAYTASLKGAVDMYYSKTGGSGIDGGGGGSPGATLKFGDSVVQQLKANVSSAKSILHLKSDHADENALILLLKEASGIIGQLKEQQTQLEDSIEKSLTVAIDNRDFWVLRDVLRSTEHASPKFLKSSVVSKARETLQKLGAISTAVEKVRSTLQNKGDVEIREKLKADMKKQFPNLNVNFEDEKVLSDLISELSLQIELKNNNLHELVKSKDVATARSLLECLSVDVDARQNVLHSITCVKGHDLFKLEEPSFVCGICRTSYEDQILAVSGCAECKYYMCENCFEGGTTPLMECAKNDCVDIARLLIQHGADINAKSNSGKCVLSVAGQHNSCGVIQLLLDHGADLENRSKSNHTPLTAAAQRGSKQAVDMLIAAGANIDASSDQGWNSLMNACSCGVSDDFTKIAISLIDAGADVNHAVTGNWTCLNYSCQKGSLEITRALINKGANVNVSSENGWTPLMQACRNGHTEIVKLLLTHNADVNKQIKTGWSALMNACRYNHAEIVKLLLNHHRLVDVTLETESGWHCLMHACREGHLEVVKLLLSHGGSHVDHKNKDGWTCLMYACRYNQADVAQLLLAYKADIKLQNGKGYMCLMHAAEQGYFDIAKMLLSCDPSILEMTNDDGETALIHSVKFGFPAVCQLLIDAGANVNHKDKVHYSALMRGAFYNHIDAVRVLLKHELVNIHETQEKGWDSLMLAARENHHEMAQLLIDSGMSVHKISTCPLGIPVLIFAVVSSHTETVRVLLNAGAPVNTPTKSGLTALSLAASRDLEMLKLIVQKGAPINAFTREPHETALMAAAGEGKLENLKYLISAGADANIKNSNGKTALDMAREAKHTESAKFLSSHTECSVTLSIN